MESTHRLSVEIFPESNRNLSLDAATRGIDIINAVTSDSLHITRSDRTTDIPSDPDGPINITPMSVYKNTSSEADFNLILTDRVILSSLLQRPATSSLYTGPQYPQPKRVYGISFGIKAPRVAIVSTNSSEPSVVVAHEMAHMLGVAEADDGRPSGHCESIDCIMYSRQEKFNDKFCMDCSKQLARSAFNLLTFKTHAR